jgi:hypothetical protein
MMERMLPRNTHRPRQRLKPPHSSFWSGEQLSHHQIAPSCAGLYSSFLMQHSYLYL